MSDALPFLLLQPLKTAIRLPICPKFGQGRHFDKSDGLIRDVRIETSDERSIQGVKSQK